MARTSNALVASEILAVEELAAVANNKVYYKDNSGVVRGVALGANGTVLTSAGATSTPTFNTPSSGTVTSVSSANAALTVATGTTTPVITSVYAPALKSATTTVDVSAATAPSNGQVLTATSGTAATWQTPGGGSPFASDISVNSLTVGKGLNSRTAQTALGEAALGSNTTGSYNTAIGFNSLTNNTTGADNTGIGRATLNTCTIGTDNTACGDAALYGLTSGIQNTGLGRSAGSSITTGNYNVVVGSNNGSTIAALNNNVIISDGFGNIRQQIDSSGNTTFGGSVQTPTIELGNASDTTLARVSAGVISVEGVNIMTVGSTDTVTGAKTFSTAPVFNALPTGSAVSSASTASTIVTRDASKNIFGNNIVGDYTTTATAAGTTTLTVASTYQQFFTGVTTQTVVLPVTSTLTLGHTFAIKNNSTGLVTVQSSGANTIIVIAGGAYSEITCILTSGTTAASWNATYNGIVMTSGKALTVSNSLTLAGTDGKGINVGAATSGKILIGDGSNMVLSANTFPNASATTRKIIVSDGTNWIASTETYAVPGTSGNVLTSDGTNWTSAAPAAASFWTLMPGTPTRVGNTSFTVTGDITTYVAKGMVIKWTESATVRTAMVAIPSTYSAPNTTITIVGDTMASIDASSLKYAGIGVEAFSAKFAIAGTIGATGTDNANAYYATEPMRVIGAEMQAGTAGTTNSTTVNIVNGTGTVTLASPTLGSTVAATATPQAPASSALSLALNDRIQVNITAIQTTPSVDLYCQLYLWPTRFNNLP